jgi:ERCC4-related helicase
MLPIKKLGLSANQWQFLGFPEKYAEVSPFEGRELFPESTRRQFLTVRDILARLNGSCGEKEHRGILLADDVGLGKTTVAALVAWVVASAGEKRSVRILAPNDVMVRRWEEELLSHVAPLQVCAPALGVLSKRVKAQRLRSLSPGYIQVVKHSYAASNILACDLLIVDEAHRAKSENARFNEALKKQKKSFGRVLILTATPFSIRLDELQQILTLIGGESAHGPVRAFSLALENLYTGNTARNQEGVAEGLATKARAAVESLKEFVIRHGTDDLPGERRRFGLYEDWSVGIPEARDRELKIMLCMDRALHVVKDNCVGRSKVTNDPRFHVGWRHLDQQVRGSDLKTAVQRLSEPAKSVVEGQLKSIRGLLKEVGVHPKIAAVAAAVKSTIEQGEKVVLFCHHHATAQELTLHLASILPKARVPRLPAETIWRTAWRQVLAAGEARNEELRDTFVEWLCADSVRAQTWSWLSLSSPSATELAAALRNTHGRHTSGAETIAEAAERLYDDLVRSRSSRVILRQDRLKLVPGANGVSRVLGICEPGGTQKEEKRLFIHNQQPDVVISVFNSPFGADVLVTTDKLSEGIDLHRYCRHLIHYELDPSPIRTVQRNGRIRRVNSWAAVTGQPILYAYPAFRGTRDYKLVQIMQKRIASFSLLLGGAKDFDVDEVVGSEEEWRNSVIASAKAKLKSAGGQLRAREPGSV